MKSASFARQRASRSSKGLHRHGARRDLEGVAERAVGVRKAEEEVAVLVLRRAADDAAVGEQHVEREQCVMHEPVAKRGRLDADARRGAPQRDRFQLRDHAGHDAVLQRRVHQIGVGRHALGRDARARGVDFHHLVEAREIDARARLPLAVAKQVGRALCETDPARAARAQAGAQPGELVRVAAHR